MSNTTDGTTLMVQGRLVWVAGGNLFTGKKLVDDRTKQPILDASGNQVVEYGFGLAVAKVDANGQQRPEFLELWNALHQEAFKIYPSGQLPQGFSFKFKDGDSDVTKGGQPYSSKEGYAGHLVISCTTRIPLKCFKFEGGNNILVNDGINAGDYVNAQIQIKAHPPIGQGVAGLYINPSAVQLAAKGKEIINAPSGDQIFGQNAPAYSGQVVAPENPTMPNVQTPVTTPAGMPQQSPAQNPMAAPAPQQAPVAAPQANPHYGVLPQTHQPANPSPAAPTPGMPSTAQPAAPMNQPAAPVNPAPQAVQNTPMMPSIPGMPTGQQHG